MEKMELYHIHKIGKYDKIWKEKKEIIISENFKNGMLKRQNDFCLRIDTPYGNPINIHDYMTMVLQSIKNGEEISKEELEEILSLAYHASYYGNMFKREAALEDYRKDNRKNLPSRLHSIYFTDEKGIDYWINALNAARYELYRVEVEGNIFKTNEQLLPNETLSYIDAYNNAYNYWNPNFKKVPDCTNEYLVQGKVKVLEKI